MAVHGVHLIEPEGQALVEFGANYGPATAGGEWWRLLSSCFIHIGLVHLGFNMFILWDVGRLVERLLGNVGFLALYLTAGIAGSLASVWWNPDVLSAGASGAVFGVFGALAGFLIRARESVPPSMLKSLARSCAMLIGFNVIFGLSVKGIDNAAHLGGLAAGLVAGLIMGQHLDLAAGARRMGRNAVVGVLGAGLYFAAPSLVEPNEMPRVLSEIAPQEQAVFNTYNALVQGAQGGTLSDADFADRLEEDVLPRWRVLRAQVDAVKPASDRDRAMQRYFELREQGWTRVVEGLRSGNQDMAKEGMEKHQAADRLLLELR